MYATLANVLKEQRGQVDKFHVSKQRAVENYNFSMKV